MESELLRKVDFEYGRVSFYRNRLRFEPAKHSHFTIQNFDQILALKRQVVGRRKIFFLSKRNYSNSFDPTTFVSRKQEISRNYSGFLVVSNRQSDHLESKYVKELCPIESHYFKTLGEALGWIDSYKKTNLQKPPF